MFYWAPSSSKEEVNFLLQRGKEFVAVEVRAGKNWGENWCKGVRAIAALAGVRRRLVVCPEGPLLKTADGIEIVPFREFAGWLQAGTLWPQ